jgi:hypothetical protein
MNKGVLIAMGGGCCLLLVVVVVIVVIVARNQPSGPSGPGPAGPSGPGPAPAGPAGSGTTVSCPSGYLPCSDARFNTGFSQGASKAIDKMGFNPTQFCCKWGNAAADPRPSCKASIQKAQKAFGIFFMVFSIVATLVPIPVIGKVANGMVGLVAGVFQQGAMGALMDGVGTKPLRGCCKDAFFKSDAPKAVVAKKYKDESNREQLALWTTNDGCPVIMGTPRTLEYHRQLGVALKSFGSAAVGPKDINVMSIDAFDEKKPPIRCEFVQSGKTTWTCAQTIPKTTEYQKCLGEIIKYPTWDPSKGGPAASAFDKCKNKPGAPKPGGAAPGTPALPAKKTCTPGQIEECSLASSNPYDCLARKGCV